MDQKQIKNSGSAIRLPIIIALTLAAGIQLGARFFGNNSSITDVVKASDKFKEILTYIERSYVDSVDADSLADFGIAKMLEKLDPHTAYLPAEEAQLAASELQNGFDGIGVEFNIFNDTVYVVSPLSGGPSEAAGILSGDAIIEANGTKLTGDHVNSPLIFSTLRGQKGTKVNMKIKRKGYKALLDFSVFRDKIPTYSVDAAYLMTDNQTGYLKISRFSETTYSEFKDGLASLIKQGMKRLILDLRGNPGGYLEKAVAVADEFIAGKEILVYTDGKDDLNDRKLNAGHNGLFEKGNLVVLIDEGSASASEIVSGALQDYDRALIIGRRSFGKGLVQAPIQLADGSELRLTISRYYIPSGRSIQKPYEIGKLSDYYDELSERAVHDNIKEDSSKKAVGKAFKTKKGRTVYDGGGITPDIIMNPDTGHINKHLIALYNKNVIREYALDYANTHQNELRKLTLEQFVNQFKISDAMMANISRQAKAVGISPNLPELARSKNFIGNQVKALIARTIWKDEKGLSNSFYMVINTDDKMIQTALKNFDRAGKLAL